MTIAGCTARASDDGRDDEVVLGMAEDRVHDRDDGDVRPLLPPERVRMAERDEARDRAGRDRADERDRLEHAGHDAEQHAVRDAEDREADRRDARHEDHEDQLTADVAAEHRVRLTHNMHELAAMLLRKLPLDEVQETRRVSQHQEVPMRR